MADYYIYAVHQEDDIIKTVRTCTTYSVTTGPNNKLEKTRKTVVDDIDDNGKTIFTIYESSQNWKLGELVITEEIDGEKFIKTKANGKKCDNLDNIEQYP